MAVTPPNPFSPEAVARHLARREAEQTPTDTVRVVELQEGSPEEQVEALLSAWIHEGPDTFSAGLAALAAQLEDYAAAIEAAPESMGLEGAYHAYTAGKSLKTAGSNLADAVKSRLISLADPDGTAAEKRTAFTTPSGITFKIGPAPNPERVQLNDLRKTYPELVDTLRQEGILYHTPVTMAVYLDRAGKKKTPATKARKD